jgi:hypothetical protein
MAPSSESNSHSAAIESAVSALRDAARLLRAHQEKEVMFVGFDADSDPSTCKAAATVARAIAAEELGEDDHTNVRYGDLAELLDYVALMLE